MQTALPETGGRIEAWLVAFEIDHLAVSMQTNLPTAGPVSIARAQRLLVAIAEACNYEDRWSGPIEGTRLAAEINLAVQGVKHCLGLVENEAENADVDAD